MSHSIIENLRRRRAVLSMIIVRSVRTNLSIEFSFEGMFSSIMYNRTRRISVFECVFLVVSKFVVELIGCPSKVNMTVMSTIISMYFHDLISIVLDEILRRLDSERNYQCDHYPSRIERFEGSTKEK